MMNDEVKPVKIQFDPNQDYQRDAVDAVCGVFEGLSKRETVDFSLDIDCVPNCETSTVFEPYELLENVNNVRSKYFPPEKARLSQLAEKNSGDMIKGFDFHEYDEFTINMETGTGKTYVYLKTIYKLHEEYGFTKFIIVVPSVAIYEGVLNTFSATKKHFENMFSAGTVPNKIIEYDGNHPEICKNFAATTANSIMLMTIDSFNKASNNIYKPTDKLPGSDLLPVNYIQMTRSILILDESQNYNSDTSRAALRTLRPLCAIRYSATPGKDSPNELYRLSSFDSLQKNLVKRIEIYGTDEVQSGVAQEDYIKVVSVSNVSKKLKCILEVQVMSGGGLKLEQKEFSVGEAGQLQKATKNPAYKEIFIEDIRCVPKDSDKNKECVVLSNGLPYAVNETSCASLTKKEVFREMIRNTLEAHLKQKRKLQGEGYGDVKVLSLFFVDRVASYEGDDPIIKNLFDEEFDKIKVRDHDWKDLKAEEVRAAYFASYKNSKTKKEELLEIDENEKLKEAEKKKLEEAKKAAYNLIMKKKEQLLSLKEKVCFIFAHSALREGWDNPNVFQICALREITTENNRRQTIGRGLRLPVNQKGERIHNHDLNVLTVIANESYERYAEKLQTEYSEADGITKKQIGNARDNKIAKRNEKFKSADFNNLWNELSQETDYTIKIDTNKLISKAVEEINKLKFQEIVQIVTTHGKFIRTKYAIEIKEFYPSGIVNCLFFRENTEGEKEEHYIQLKKDDLLNKDDPILKKIKVSKVDLNTRHLEYSQIKFDDSDEVYSVGDVWTLQAQTGSSKKASEKELEDIDIPKFNLFQRAADATNLTRKTIIEIFKKCDEKVQMEFIKNPEGFSKLFITTLKEVLTNHIVEQIEYNPTGGYMDIHDKKDELFPEEKEFPSKELVPADESRSIYDYVQVDSKVEEHFVYRLNHAGENQGDVILYFKFPPKYKIRMPKMIQNYNPDWAILRMPNHEKKKTVRETKGTEDLDKLWHSNEKRKILCARKHFLSLGVDYRPVNDTDSEWYLSWDEWEKRSPALFR
ncbi:MAG: DEAD/DEAH box helicase family protein [Treponema sp.]|nr:DEAD/DEAH box helicase family protein [Treponema sp.]